MNNTNWRKWVGIGAVALAVIAAIVYGFLPQPVRVETQPVTRGPMQVVIEEEGETRVRERYVITAPVAGYAPRVTWAVGDAVQQGEALLMLEPMRSDVLDPRRRAEAEARVAAAEARLQSAREQARAATAQADYARAEHERMRGLFEAGSATQQQLDRAATEAQQAEANRTAADHAVEVAQYEVAAARTALRYSGAGTDGGNGSAERVRIPAPIDGRVLRVHHESEGVVSPGQPLLDLGDPKQLEVVVDVLSSDAVQIESGTPVRFERWGGPPLDGRVRTVEPTGRTKVSALGVEEQRVFVVADITGSSASGMDGSGQQESQPMGARSRLGDGYRVVARFITWAGEDVLQVPASALFRADGGWAVFVATDGEAEQRAVQVGHRSGLQAEVTAGLDEGERVITHPDDAIEDGTSIDPWE